MTKGRVNLKTIIVLVILVLVGVLGVLGMNTAKTFLSGAAADVEPKEVLAKSDEDGRSGVVSWKSDKESMGIVEYGTTPASLLLRAVESEAVTGHTVSLSPLKPNVSYYFRIRVGEEVYDNAGIPYSFKTNSSGEEPALVPTVVPTIVTTTTTTGGGSNCNTDNDTRVSAYELTHCNTSPTPIPTIDPCDKDKSGRVDSFEADACKN